jgi:hypothetical protein
MKHKFKFIDYSYEDDYGVRLEIDGEPLFCEGTYTFNCLEEILKTLNIDYEIEYSQEREEIKFVTKKLKLVIDDE